MRNLVTIKRVDQLQYDDEFELILYKICFHAAPMINRVKPSSLICFRNSSSSCLKDIWDQNKHIVEGIIPFSYKEVKRCEEGVQVLFYWSDWIQRIIKKRENAEYLRNNGYHEQMGIGDVLAILSDHFHDHCPHEIGLFLGYPLEDVIAFSAEEERECLGVGYWKVYSNIERARKIFDLYDKARIYIANALESGIIPHKLLEI